MARSYRDATIPSLLHITQQQQLFVLEYLIDCNASQAAIRTGYKPSAAPRLMAHPPIRDAIAKAMAARSRRVGISGDRVLAGLGQMLFGDPRSLFTPQGSLKLPADMDVDDATMLAGVKTKRVIEKDADGDPREVEMQEVRLVDRVSLTALAMRHLGMLNDKLDITVGSLADRLRAASQRVDGVTTIEAIDEAGGGIDFEPGALELGGGPADDGGGLVAEGDTPIRPTGSAIEANCENLRRTGPAIEANCENLRLIDYQNAENLQEPSSTIRKNDELPLSDEKNEQILSKIQDAIRGTPFTMIPPTGSPQKLLDAPRVSAENVKGHHDTTDLDELERQRVAYMLGTSDYDPDEDIAW